MASLAKPFQTVWAASKLLYQSDTRPFLISVVIGIIEALFYPLLLLIIWNIFSLVTEGKMHDFLRQGLPIVAALFLLLAVQHSLSMITETAKSVLRTESSLKINARLMEKMSQIPYHYFEENAFQAKYSLILGEASYRPGILVDALINVLISLVAFMSIIVALFIIAPLLVVVLIITIALSAIEVQYQTRSIDLQTSSAPDLFRMQFLSQKSIDAFWQRDIRTYRSSVLRDEYHTLSQRYLINLKRLLYHFQVVRSFVGIVVSLLIAGAVGSVIWLISTGALNFAEAGVLLPAIYLGLQQGRMFSMTLGSLAECLLYIEQVFDFLNSEFKASPEILPLEEVSTSATHERAIHLDAITYRYPGRDRDALSKVSYRFIPGVTAIVGPNGAGKSTLVKVLTGLLSPTEGIMSMNLPKAETATQQDTLFQRVVLFQEPSHLYLSIRQNVTMSFEREMDEDERIYNILKGVGLLEVVRDLPQGIDTLVGAGFGGETNLSGGQWQRLALARLLYHDAPVIILDEPVASLDPEGERAIFEIFAQEQHKIIIFTTHRYDSIPRGTTIVVLVDGTITEVGTHEELLQRRHDYWSLYTWEGKRDEKGGVDP